MHQLEIHAHHASSLELVGFFFVVVECARGLVMHKSYCAVDASAASMTNASAGLDAILGP